MRYGGRVKFNISSNTTSITLSPAAIYKFNKYFAAGGSLSFGYANFRNSNTDLYNYGGSILGLYNPIKQIQLSAELEQVFVNEKYDGDIPDYNYNYQAFLVGAGYRMRNVTVGVRYDLLYKENKNLYASAYTPFVQVFF